LEVRLSSTSVVRPTPGCGGRSAMNNCSWLRTMTRSMAPSIMRMYSQTLAITSPDVRFAVE
jgi:hypothetical protein